MEAEQKCKQCWARSLFQLISTYKQGLYHLWVVFPQRLHKRLSAKNRVEKLNPLQPPPPFFHEHRCRWDDYFSHPFPLIAMSSHIFSDPQCAAPSVVLEVVTTHPKQITLADNASWKRCSDAKKNIYFSTFSCLLVPKHFFNRILWTQVLFQRPLNFYIFLLIYAGGSCVCQSTFLFKICQRSRIHQWNSMRNDRVSIHICFLTWSRPSRLFRDFLQQPWLSANNPPINHHFQIQKRNKTLTMKRHPPIRADFP